jgi:Rho GTPase-activating protein 20, PH domain
LLLFLLLLLFLSLSLSSEPLSAIIGAADSKSRMRLQVAELQLRIRGWTNYVCERQFVREGGEYLANKKQRYLFLFNDTLLLCSRRSTNIFQFKQAVPLAGAHIKAEGEEGLMITRSGGQNALHLDGMGMAAKLWLESLAPQRQ